MSEKYLKPQKYYSDLYDKHTVEDCRRWLDNPISSKKTLREAKEKKLDETEAIRMMVAADRLRIYFYTGERYIKKAGTVKEWMDWDEKRDRLLETAAAPADITCLQCGRPMFVSHKHLDFGGLEGSERVFYFYDCPLGHTPRRAFYNDGEEYKPKVPICPKCDNNLTEENKKIGKKIVRTSTCDKCGHTETYEIDLRPKKQKVEKPDPNFITDRKRFCLSEEDGQNFIRAKGDLERVSQLMDEIREKEKNKDLYDKVSALKKLKITELEEMLTSVLEKAGYIKLEFKNPEITKDVIVPFVVHDIKADRQDRISSYDLEVLFRKILKDTNWRLMSDGVSYRLGILEGRLRGYEREEELLRLVK